MQAIETHIRNERYFKEERVPLQWLKVCDKLAQDDRQAMGLTHFETMSLGCNVRSDQVERLLKLLSEVGIVMYSTEASLRDIVVTNPVVFMIGASSKFVCDHAVHVAPEHGKAKLLVSEWQVGQQSVCIFVFSFSVCLYLFPFVSFSKKNSTIRTD
jgi:hypothetical protein